MLTLFCLGQMDLLGMKVAPNTCCDWWLYFVAEVIVYKYSKLLIIIYNNSKLGLLCDEVI
jgi:hypothetical protein